MDRRRFLLSAISVSLLGGVGRPISAAPGQPGNADHVLGAADAAVRVTEYASLTCPHCARFHTAALPQARLAWIESGKARLAYRHFPLDGLALRAALVADAMPDNGSFFDFIGKLFETQAQWMGADDPIKAVVSLAGDAGLSAARAEAALQSDSAMKAVLDKVVEARDGFGVNATPTFIVNGRKYVGVTDYEIFDRILEAASRRR